MIPNSFRNTAGRVLGFTFLVLATFAFACDGNAQTSQSKEKKKTTQRKAQFKRKARTDSKDRKSSESKSSESKSNKSNSNDFSKKKISTGDYRPTGSASVKSVPRNKILKHSQKIDALIEKQLNSKQQSFNQPASDEIFLRRAYLDIVGRIPTLEEATRFLDSKNKNKRAALVDELLDSYGHVSRQFNYFADLLRIQTRVRNVIGQPYIDYVKDSLESNKPYDQMVQEMLSSEGPMLERGNGAVGYYLRDVGMPEDNMSNSVRIFLGTRLECAQCHDHPFDKWTQRQYFEMVAFTGGMAYRLPTPDSNHPNEIRKLRNKIDDERLKPIVRRLVQPMTYGIRGSGTGLARLPENFMGNSGEEFEIVKGKTMFDADPLVNSRVPSRTPRVNKRNLQNIPGARPINSRQAYAKWMTESDNPRFSTVIANRMWKQIMGLGLIEPVDVIEDSTEASNPELMEYLAQTMIDLNFDLKQFQRVIYNTRTYNSQAFGGDVTNAADYNFGGPLVRRMSAEQIWDSMLTMTISNTDRRKYADSIYRANRANYVSGDDMYDVYENLQDMTADEILELAQSMLDKGRKGMMMSSQKKNPKARERFKSEIRKLKTKIREAKKSRNRALEARLQLKLNALVSEAKLSRNGNQLLRASELSSPAKPGHFLREFGQSDRDTIENSNSDPAVTQVLSLMNGFIENQIGRNPGTILRRNVLEAKKEDKIDAVYLTILSRRATNSETSLWAKEFRKSQDGAGIMADMIWVLANSNEFIFAK